MKRISVMIAGILLVSSFAYLCGGIKIYHSDPKNQEVIAQNVSYFSEVQNNSGQQLAAQEKEDSDVVYESYSERTGQSTVAEEDLKREEFQKKLEKAKEEAAKKLAEKKKEEEKKKEGEKKEEEKKQEQADQKDSGKTDSTDVNQKPTTNAQSSDAVQPEDLTKEQDKILSLSPKKIDKTSLVKRFAHAVIIGDSITEACEGYGYLSSSVIYAKSGLSVCTADDYFAAARGAAPEVFFLCFGLNDIERYEGKPERMVKDYKAEIALIQKELPDAEIYVQGLLPVQESKVTNSCFKYRQKYNEQLEQMCTDLGIHYVDASFLLIEKPDLYDGDGIHPKSSFYPLWLTYFSDVAGL